MEELCAGRSSSEKQQQRRTTDLGTRGKEGAMETLIISNPPAMRQ